MSFVSPKTALISLSDKSNLEELVNFLISENVKILSTGGTYSQIKNITQNKRLEGASTITQQVAKNFLLTNEVSMKRKIKEAILAFRIERAYTKERILELYLNQIYLGSGAYGVAAASLEYFDKSIKDLNYSEAALLAALPKAPSKYNPYKYSKIAKFRRNLVLNNLEENNFISKNELKNFKVSKLNLKKRKIEILNEANSYTEEVRRSVKENYGFEKLYSQGLTISSECTTKVAIHNSPSNHVLYSFIMHKS